MPAAAANSEVKPCGFYVTRAVQAGSVSEAGAVAIRRLQGEPKFQKMVDAYEGLIPELTIEEAAPTQGIEAKAVNRSGYAFYEDE